MNDIMELSGSTSLMAEKSQPQPEELKYYLNLDLQINKDILPEVLLMQVLEFLKDKGTLQSARVNTNRW